jgi:hypothetical protein
MPDNKDNGNERKNKKAFDKMGFRVYNIGWKVIIPPFRKG